MKYKNTNRRDAKSLRNLNKRCRIDYGIDINIFNFRNPKNQVTKNCHMMYSRDKKRTSPGTTVTSGDVRREGQVPPGHDGGTRAPLFTA